MTWILAKSNLMGRKPEELFFRLSVPCLLLGLISGCRPAPPVPSTPAPAMPPMRSGTVNVERYLELHPAAAQLRNLRASLAIRPGAPAVTLLPLDAPAPVDLPAVALSETPAPPDLNPDRERARNAVREEFTFRRLARPDRFEDRYQFELARLRRRYLEARTEIPQVETEPQLAEAVRRAREMDRLERRIRELDDSPARRALLSLEELKARRTEREQAQRALDELRREEIQRLREALEVPRRQPRGEPEIPPAELARVERERNEARSAADLQLIQEEQQARARMDAEVLPPPLAAEAEALPAPSEPPQRALDGRLAHAQAAPRIAAPPSLQPTRAAQRAEYDALRAAIFRDLAVVSREAARRQGIELHPRRAGIPDRTLELLPAVRRLLAATTGKIERIRKPGKLEGRER